jgi:hypothetical protein
VINYSGCQKEYDAAGPAAVPPLPLAAILSDQG